MCGPEGAAGWDTLAPYAASIADLASAGAIVVAGDTDLTHRAPVVELRIRKAVQAGARVVTVGAGGTRLETLRGSHHVSAGPGTAHVELLRAAANEGELSAAVGDSAAILIWAGPMRPAIAAVLAHVAHARGWTVLRTPRAANELGCQAAGLGSSTPDEALAAAEEGRIKAIVLLGADPVGDWHNGERWRAALGRSFFALQVTAVQNDSSGWATTIVPASTVLEQDGTLTNLEGRTQRVRAAATAPQGRHRGVRARRGRRREAGRRGAAGRAVGLRRHGLAPARLLGARAGRPSASGPRSASGRQPRERPRRRMPRPPSRRPAPSSSATASSCPAQPSTTARRCTSSGAPASRSRTTTPQRLGVKPGDRVRVTYDGGEHEGAAIVLRRLRPGVVRVAARRPYVGPGTVVVAPPEAAGA